MTLPATLPGVEPYHRGTAARLAWWVTRHQLQKPAITIMAVLLAMATLIVSASLGLTTAAALATAALVAFYGCVAAATVIVHLATVRRWARDGLVGYFTANASQLVHIEDGRWVLSEHHARRRGVGHGAELRAVVWPHLAAEADRAGAAIGMATRSTQLAQRYLAEMPGLEIEQIHRDVIELVRPNNPGW